MELNTKYNLQIFWRSEHFFVENSEVLRYFDTTSLKNNNTSAVKFMYKVLSLENYRQVCYDIETGLYNNTILNRK